MATYKIVFTRATKGGYLYGQNANLYINGRKIKEAHTKGGGMI